MTPTYMDELQSWEGGPGVWQTLPKGTIHHTPI